MTIRASKTNYGLCRATARTAELATSGVPYLEVGGTESEIAQTVNELNDAIGSGGGGGGGGDTASLVLVTTTGGGPVQLTRAPNQIVALDRFGAFGPGSSPLVINLPTAPMDLDRVRVTDIRGNTSDTRVVQVVDPNWNLNGGQLISFSVPYFAVEMIYFMGFEDGVQGWIVQSRTP